MDEKTLKALKASIQHWKENEEGPFEKASTAWGDCALCKLFLMEFHCEGCPVYLATGEPTCHETPYFAACEHLSDNDEKEFRAAAKAEREFLESLLPKEPADDCT